MITLLRFMLGLPPRNETLAARQSRLWRQAGGNGFAPRRLHPQLGSCAGDGD